MSVLLSQDLRERIHKVLGVGQAIHHFNRDGTLVKAVGPGETGRFPPVELDLLGMGEIKGIFKNCV
jgi:hypothetical protein